MRSGILLQTVVVLCSAFLLARGGSIVHVMTLPQDAVLEIGSNFTATCTLINTTEATADDLYWRLGNDIVPPERYTKINSTAVSVTVGISERSNEILYCYCKHVSPNVRLYQDRFLHGIVLVKGYRPEKPLNLSCMALQEKTYISPTLSCEWVALGRQTTEVPTVYTLFVKLNNLNKTFQQIAEKNKNKAQVTMEIFHNHVPVDIWVEARNKLGVMESEHLYGDSNAFVKTNPPSSVSVTSEKVFPSSLLINWFQPIDETYLELVYQIRFCPHGAELWTYVPRKDTVNNIISFRLQNLQPDTEYVVQVRCKYVRENQGHWSDWSSNVTQRTPEDKPSSKPDVWVNITEGAKGRDLQFVCKDPVSANGRIRRINVRVGSRGSDSDGSMQWESVSLNRSEQQITVLHESFLPHHKPLKVYVTAINSVGMSPEALLVVPARVFESVQDLLVHPVEGKLSVEWKPPNSSKVTEYVLQWSGATGMDWQRERRTSRSAVIKGNLEPFVCYTVSLYPLYSGWIGQGASTQVYVEQGAPSKAPDVSLLGDPGRNEATLVWDQVPTSSRRGFITHYTLFYGPQAVTLPANSTSYTLQSLTANTKYDVLIQASTVAGSKNGSRSAFRTLKYAPGQMEGIAVGVSLCFLFVVVLTMLFCFYKKDKLKQKFWPQIPDPVKSTIEGWTPDHSQKAELPTESCVSEISVLEVDASGCVSEEDKSSPSMKKDKFLSEEHSSGIGGSSCMSSPRHSVSDSDEGADMADSTAGTVQYSSVVASAGYKGQTPHPQPQAPALFSRSESTQPLLDSEENQDSDRAPRSLLRSSEEEETLNFCPVEEEEEQTGSYMSQRGDYRPQ